LDIEGTSDHAEVENTPGSREAVQEDGKRKISPEQGVQAPHPDEQDAQPEARAQGYFCDIEGRHGAAAQDVAELELPARSARAVIVN
jgi:hypothetical protein